jgi:hypothetical protein
VAADADRREKPSDQLRHGGQLPGHDQGITLNLRNLQPAGFFGKLIKIFQQPLILQQPRWVLPALLLIMVCAGVLYCWDMTRRNVTCSITPSSTVTAHATS